MSEYYLRIKWKRKVDEKFSCHFLLLFGMTDVFNCNADYKVLSDNARFACLSSETNMTNKLKVRDKLRVPQILILLV